MTYEIWNTNTGNAMGEFTSEAEALAFVREAVCRHGRAYADQLFLGVTSGGRSKPVAEGSALADRAAAAVRSTNRVSVNA